jgi:hypothetical protein
MKDLLSIRVRRGEERRKGVSTADGRQTVLQTTELKRNNCQYLLSADVAKKKNRL